MCELAVGVVTVGFLAARGEGVLVFAGGPIFAGAASEISAELLRVTLTGFRS